VAVNRADISALARDIGPRLPGTGKERRAVHYVMRRLREIGVPAALLPVRVPPSFAFMYVVLFCWISVGVPIGILSPLIGFIISLLGAIVFALELLRVPVISRLFATRRGSNVLGIIPARVNDEIGQPARRVILTAHIDTGRSGLLWHTSLIKVLRSFAITVVCCVIWIPILLLAGNIDRFGSIWQIAWLPMIILLLAAILLTESELRGTALSGANDDASGVAALLALARVFKDEHLNHVETWFLFTTGEEAGQAGMHGFLEENSFLPEETYFINLDQVGAGQIRYTQAEGLLRLRPSSARLLKYASEITSQHPEWGLAPAEYRLLPTDQYAALIEGYEGISVIGLDEQGLPPHWHQTSDTLDSVDTETVQISIDFVRELIRKVDTEATPRPHLADTQDLPLPLADEVTSS
jgi:hypothetical protein